MNIIPSFSCLIFIFFALGSLAGASIALFIVGLAIGVGGLYLYRYRKDSQATDNIDLVQQYGENPNYNNLESENYDENTHDGEKDPWCRPILASGFIKKNSGSYSI